MPLEYILGAPIVGPHPNPLPDVDGNCTVNISIPWVSHIFHECVDNNVQYAGFFLGLVSILCWLVVFLPQFYDAYKNGKMDEAISPLFLFLWLLGDASNLVGSLLSKQLGTQIAVAYYYIAMDTLVLLQFTYYFLKNRRKRKVTGELRVSYDSMAKNNRGHVIYCTGALLLLASTAWFTLSPWQQTAMHDGSRGVGRTLLGLKAEPSRLCKVQFLNTGNCLFYNNIEVIGYTCGCLSALFYLASRVPQLYKNYKRKSVEGVAIMMFILTVLGNVFYGLSIILEYTSVVFLIRHLPWLVGSLGTLVFDCAMLLQFRLYGRAAPLNIGINRDETNCYDFINGDETSSLLAPKVRSDDEGFYRRSTKTYA